MLMMLLQLTLVDEQFLVEDKSCVTLSSDLCTESRTTAQHLLSHYVRMQGLAVSQVRCSQVRSLARRPSSQGLAVSQVRCSQVRSLACWGSLSHRYGAHRYAR